MTNQQILEQFLNFAMQQNAVNDETIKGLQARVAELEKQLAERPVVLQSKEN